MEIIIKQLLSMIAVTIFLVASAAAKEYPVGEGGEDTIPELDCVMEPSEIVDVGSAIPGVVEAIHAHRSDLVKKGAIIVELESSVERASLELAKVRAGLDTAIELRQESAKFGSLTQKRNQELLRKSAISLQDMDKLKTETRIAELQVRQEQDNKSIAELEYSRAQMILQQRSIRSPVEGVVMERFKSVGEFVEDGPLIRVAQLDPLHVEVIVPVGYLGRIAPGMQANVMPGLAGIENYLATVERVDRVADAASGTYGVRLSLPNPDYKIPAGLRCQLSFLPKQMEESEQIVDDTRAVPARGQSQEVKEDLAAPFPLESTTSVVTLEVPVVESTEPLEACYSIGPVADEVLVGQLSEGLKDKFDTRVLRTETIEVDNGFLVLAPLEPDRQATRQLLARLDRAGISDRYLITRGNNKGRVSLGYFRGIEGAVKQKELLALKSLQAEVVPRRKEIQQYWLDVSLQAGPGLPGQFKEIAANLTPAASFKPLACSSQLVHR